jgi:hypothetical protein
MKSVSKIVVFSTLALVMSVPCFAQDVPPAELSFGYSFLQVAGEDGESLPAGWYGEVAGNLGAAVALIGQVHGNYKSIGIQGLNVDVDVHTIGGGLRFLGRSRGAAPFAQVLFGVARTDASSNVSGLLPFVVSESNRDPFLQIGGGVNLMPGAPIGLRLGGDYLRVLNDEGANAFRFNLGIVVPLGR